MIRNKRFLGLHDISVYDLRERSDNLLENKHLTHSGDCTEGSRSPICKGSTNIGLSAYGQE